LFGVFMCSKECLDTRNVCCLLLVLRKWLPEPGKEPCKYLVRGTWYEVDGISSAKFSIQHLITKS
jgi:hypothetical protein